MLTGGSKSLISSYGEGIFRLMKGLNYVNLTVPAPLLASQVVISVSHITPKFGEPSFQALVFSAFPSPHFSPAFVARVSRCRCGGLRGLEVGAVVVDTTSNRL